MLEEEYQQHGSEEEYWQHQECKAGNLVFFLVTVQEGSMPLIGKKETVDIWLIKYRDKTVY